MDIFEEDAQQREEELQKWWHENWKSIIFGILFALIVITGVWVYRDYMHKVRQQNAELYYTNVLVNDSSDVGAVAKVQQFISEQKNVYGQLASLQLSKTFVQIGKYKEALDVLSQNIGVASDKLMDDLISTRAARIAIEIKDFDAAEKLLNGVKTKAFEAVVYELKGDLAKAQNKNSEAIDFYNKSIELQDANVANSILKMKRDSLLTVDGSQLNTSAQ